MTGQLDKIMDYFNIALTRPCDKVPDITATLDSFRDTLEHLGRLVLTDPASGPRS